MSGHNVLPRERLILPDPVALKSVMDTMTDADLAQWIGLAELSLRGVRSHVGEEPTPQIMQAVVNGTAIAFLALGHALGIGEIAEVMVEEMAKGSLP